jgi:hypothetical protein
VNISKRAWRQAGRTVGAVLFVGGGILSLSSTPAGATTPVGTYPTYGRFPPSVGECDDGSQIFSYSPSEPLSLTNPTYDTGIVLPAGLLKIEKYFSWDGYTGREFAVEANESWAIAVGDTRTALTTDLPDGLNAVLVVDAFPSIEQPGGSVRIVHSSLVGPTDGSANSVVPMGFCYSVSAPITSVPTTLVPTTLAATTLAPATLAPTTLATTVTPTPSLVSVPEVSPTPSPTPAPASTPRVVPVATQPAPLNPTPGVTLGPDPLGQNPTTSVPSFGAPSTVPSPPVTAKAAEAAVTGVAAVAKPTFAPDTVEVAGVTLVKPIAVEELPYTGYESGSNVLSGMAMLIWGLGLMLFCRPKRNELDA